MGTTVLLCTAVGVSATGAPFAPQADADARLTGLWTLDAGTSEPLLAESGRDVRQTPGTGGGGGRGGGRGRAAAIELIRLLMVGDERLVIVGRANALTERTADGRVTLLAAAKSSTVSVAGRSMERTVVSSGNQMVKRFETQQGWTVTRTFTLAGAGRLEVRFEGRGGGAPPVKIRRTYSRSQ
jgi:hypothetical protein